MQQVIVGSKYQIVIPKEVRKKIKSLAPGRKVMVQSIDENTIAVKAIKTSWLEKSIGIAQEAWKGIDTTQYLQKLRGEWDRVK